MKALVGLSLFLTSITTFASNYPTDYCHANVRVCENGPGIVAQVSSGCNTSVYIIGYKNQGILGDSSFVNAVVNIQFTDSTSIKRDFRISPDWHQLGFLSSELYLVNTSDISGSRLLSSISIAFSDGNGRWDSRYGENYSYPIGQYQGNNCYTVKTNQGYTSNVPLAAWDVINEAMGK